MKKESLTFNLIFITLPALFLALLMAEIALRASGSIYFATRNHSTKETPSKGVVRFLCLGDSFTFGMGAPRGKDYPQQLKEILIENGHDSVAVYNAGVPGLTSSLIANKLNENINKYKPDFIIIMVGSNNAWNLEDSSYFLFNKVSPNPFGYVERMLSKVRIYKLFKIWYLTGGHKLLLEKYKAKPVDPSSVSALLAGSSFFDQTRYKLAEEHIDKALLLDPHNYRAYWDKASMLAKRRDFKSAKDALNKAMLLIDYYDEEDLCSLLRGMDGVFIDFGERFEVLEKLKSLIRRDITDDGKKKRLLGIVEAHEQLLEGMPWDKKILMYDLGRIMARVRAQNIKVILQTYPVSDVNETVREFSRKFAVPLVDNERVFKEKSKHINIGNLFVSVYDPHCNAQGYRLIAENVYGFLIRNNYLPRIEKAP